MCNENTMLTDEQVLKIASTVEESKNETDSLLSRIEAEYANIDNSNAPLEEGEAQFISDGLYMEAEESNEIDFNHFDSIDKSIDDIINDNIKDNIAQEYNLSDEEVIKFINLITRIRNKEKFNVYNELPEVLKKQVDDMVKSQNIPLNQKPNLLKVTAQLLVEEIMKDAELDSLSIDFEKAMKELIPSPMEMYSEFNKDYIENEFVKVAEKIKDENPKVSNNLLAMRKGYIDAYTYEPMYELFNNPKIQKNIRRANVLWSRTNTEYLRLAEICKFKLYSLQELLQSLQLLGYSETSAKRLITLFVYTYTNGVEDYSSEEEYNDIYRNAFANYFECNIKHLSISDNLLTDFSIKIKEDLEKLSNHIDTVIAEKEAELSNKKKNKKG